MHDTKKSPPMTGLFIASLVTMLGLAGGRGERKREGRKKEREREGGAKERKIERERESSLSKFIQ